MSYLLDTHTLIWSIVDKEKLSAKVRDTLEEIENDILVSAVSLWEISIKFSLGKLALSGFKPEELVKLSADIGFKLISISAEDCATCHLLNSTVHKDPFDRMLIWQALRNNYKLITKDNTITQYKSIGLKTFW